MMVITLGSLAMDAVGIVAKIKQSAAVIPIIAFICFLNFIVHTSLEYMKTIENHGKLDDSGKLKLDDPSQTFSGPNIFRPKHFPVCSNCGKSPPFIGSGLSKDCNTYALF